LETTKTKIQTPLLLSAGMLFTGDGVTVCHKSSFSAPDATARSFWMKALMGYIVTLQFSTNF